ncbi:DUF4344 domain-containing metallopeptidase [Streptomyces sp. NPDC058290]|uniref:DUF4344 domain-containing metallopeptidase n=1 Tax=Streptomyces sp. NPDC058290 TaxID=3346426 RepID=UPI0036E791ED
MGHALQRQLALPNLGLEEDAADGFASFNTVNEIGPDPSLAAAMVFDEVARKEGKLTLEGFASDHPVTQQRVFNFLCNLDGSDPKKFDGPLVGAGCLPRTRAPLCPQSWAALDYGWWTQLKPHFSQKFKGQGDKSQEAARPPDRRDEGLRGEARRNPQRTVNPGSSAAGRPPARSSESPG